MGILKDNTSTEQLACAQVLEETMFSTLDLAESWEKKSYERHILNCDFVIWVGRMLGQSSTGRDLGDEGNWSPFPHRVFAVLPFSPC